MERYIKFFFKKLSIQRTCIWEYSMNHTDTEKYKTHSCFALCPVRSHTGVCSGVKGIVFFLKSVRAPAYISPVKDRAKPDTGRSSSFATFKDHASASNNGYQIISQDILSFLS